MEFGRMVRLCLEGNFQEAMPIHFRFNELFNLLFVDGNPAGVKCTLNQLGLIENELRLPLVPTRMSTNEKIHNLLKQLYTPLLMRKGFQKISNPLSEKRIYKGRQA